MSRPAALVTLGAGYGNIVMATPTIAAVRSLGYEVDVLVESHLPDAAILLTGWDAVNTIYLTRKSLLRAEAGRGYDAVIRTRWHNGASLDLGSEFRPDSLPLQTTHEAVVNLSAARALGYTGPMPASHVENDLPFWPLPPRFIAIAPGYGGVRRKDWRRKAWPHWRTFCDLYRERTRMDVLILGADHDGRRWMKSASRPWLHNLCGRTSIRGAAGVIKRSERLIALDNGLAHIGAALGKPVTALFGATSELKNRPLGRDVRIVAAKMDCRPCQMTPRWKSCSDYRCMQEIGVEDVMSACEIGSSEGCAMTAAHCTRRLIAPVWRSVGPRTTRASATRMATPCTTLDHAKPSNVPA